jgi:hypothetical protein
MVLTFSLTLAKGGPSQPGAFFNSKPAELMKCMPVPHTAQAPSARKVHRRSGGVRGLCEPWVHARVEDDRLLVDRAQAEVARRDAEEVEWPVGDVVLGDAPAVAGERE